jgi:TonB-linked SusC/RagA family outer membrane protein
MRKIIIKHPILNKRFLIKHSLLLFFIACYLSSFAKESGNENGPSISKNMAIAIHGKVVDDKGVALTGATITEKGTTNTTLTNSKGEFTINVRNQNSILVISYVGYVTREVSPSSSGNDLVVELTSSDASLQTVIVVGYGTQKKVSSTAAISSVKGEELAQAPVANISNALAGRVSGVIVNANGGRPGADNSDIYIRGIGTNAVDNNGKSTVKPLIVVDGVIRDNISQVDPNAIASVTVLKDAAAVAPYGLGGANGVILITTIRGVNSTKPTLTFGGYYGVQQPTYVPKMLSALDYMRLRNEAFLNEHPGSTNLQFPDSLINNYTQLNKQNPDLHPITDAYNTVVNKNAPMYQADMQLRGGSNHVRYFAGLGYYNQKGLFDPVGYDRYNYNVNVDVDVTPTTLVSLSINGSYEKTDNVDVASSTDNLLRGVYKFVPIQPLLYSNGKWGEFAGNAPLGVLNSGGYNNQNTTSLLSTIAIEQKLSFIKGLSVKGTFSYDPYNFFQKQWHRPFYYWSQDVSTTPYTYTQAISTQEGGAATYTWLNEHYYQNNSYTYDAYLNYHNTFGKSEITGLVVAEAKNNKQLEFNARRNNFAVNIDELSLGSSDRKDFDNGGGSSTGSQIGYVYRLNYGYDNKYLFEASGRYDGHYYFAPGSRWVYFPAFSVGWVASNEKFMQSFKNLDYLKFRASWGKSGALGGGPFQYLSGYNLYGPSYAFGSGTLVQGSYTDLEPNPNITWEVSTKTDIGFEANLWRGLLRIEADYFGERRTGMLLAPQVTVPVEYGLNLAQQNAGIMENHGFEITLGSQKRLSNGLQLGIDGNFSYAKNKLIQIYETPTTKNSPNRSRTGRPFQTQFGYHSLGLFSAADDKNNDGIINAEDGYNVAQFGELHPGDIKYADISGPDGKPDGKIDSYDETVIGDPTIPAIVYGANLTAAWKGFDLTLFFQGAAMSSRNVQGFYTVPFFNNNSNSTYEYYNNRWTPDNQGAKYPRANQNPYANNTQSSDFWIVQTSYLRLRTASIGYTLPESASKKVGMTRLRLYATGQNVFTASNLKFTDPQTNGETGYPLMRTFIFGLNASF